MTMLIIQNTGVKIQKYIQWQMALGYKDYESMKLF